MTICLNVVTKDRDMFNIPPKLKASKWRYVLGGFLILVGTVTLILPVGPGLFLIFLGLYLINSDWAIKKMNKFKVFANKWKQKFNKK